MTKPLDNIMILKEQLRKGFIDLGKKLIYIIQIVIGLEKLLDDETRSFFKVDL